MPNVDLTAIIQGMCAVARSVPTPAGAAGDLVVFEKPPTSFDAFPCLFPLEQDTDLGGLKAFGGNTGELVHAISAYLLFGNADQDYLVGERRLWSQPITDAFDTDATRLGGACIGLFLRRISYGKAAVNGGEYLATTFQFTVLAPRG